MVLVLGGGAAWWQAEALGNRLEAFNARHSRFTDAYRPIIWTGTGALIRENPVLGVGPGGFPAATRAWREDYSRRFPVIWYFTRNAPDGHAHNDLLHLAAVGGLPAGLLFLVLMFLCVRETARRLSEGADGSGRNLVERRLLVGVTALFPAGLFQCYFQDDEVVVLFWVLIALGLAASFARSGDSTSSESA